MAEETAAAAAASSQEVDYSLANPDTLTKYKSAAEIAQKVLAKVIKLALDGVTVLNICEAGDKALEEETAKVFKGKKISKGIAFPTTVSPNDLITPFSPLPSDATESAIKLHTGDVIKIQLGAQIDGFAAIVGDTIVVQAKEGSTDKQELDPKTANLLHAVHFVNEAFLRLILPPSLGIGAEEGAAEQKPPTQSKISSTLQKVAQSFGCNVVESTTTHLFERNEVEAKKRIVLNPGNDMKGDGTAEVGEVWGVEVAVTTGSGKIKALSYRPTVMRKTTTSYQLKLLSSRKTFSEIGKKFGAFPFSLRQMEDERTAKMGVLECVRNNVVRQYEVWGEKDGAPVARVFSTIAITKNGITKITSPAPLDENIKSDKKVEDEELLKLLAGPISKAGKSKPKKKKKAEE